MKADIIPVGIPAETLWMSFYNSRPEFELIFRIKIHNCFAQSRREGRVKGMIMNGAKIRVNIGTVMWDIVWQGVRWDLKRRLYISGLLVVR